MSPEILIEKPLFRQIPDESLPIFMRKFDDLTLFYAPGYLSAARAREAAEIFGILSGELPFGNPVPHYLIRAAQDAERKWNLNHDPANYKPVCLTLYTSLACNLNCTYCFSEGERQTDLWISRERIIDAAKIVLENCREKEEPFTVVFHGGGEPTMDPRLPALLAELRVMASAEQVQFRSYLATNGVMKAEDAVLFAKSFSQIGLSVDGPPDIQNRQRPLHNGGNTSDIVERTAGIFRNYRGDLTVRVTVLPENYIRIPEIVSYCRETLAASQIRMEPAYHQGTTADEAESFCDNFLKAKAMFPELSYSGTRPGEIHGRYCHCFRQVLQLVPTIGSSVCFAVSSQAEAEKKGLNLFLNDDLFATLSREDPRCLNCFNRFHCSRGCPDVCPAQKKQIQDFGSFRCRVSRKLAETELLDTARHLLFEYAKGYGYSGLIMNDEVGAGKEDDEREVSLFDSFSGKIPDL